MPGRSLSSMSIAVSALILMANAGPQRSSPDLNEAGSSLRVFSPLGVSAVRTPTCAASSASGQSHTAAEHVAMVQAALREFKTDWMEDTIPDGAAPLLATLKHRLRDLIMAELNSNGNDPSRPDQVEARILSELESQGVKVGQLGSIEITGPPYDREYVYGGIYEVSVRQPTSDSGLLAVTTTLGVCCGEDTSLYVVRRQGNRSNIVLAEEANPYREVSGALGRFQYYVEEPDTDGQFFVVTANVNPWCTSNWQSLRYQVVRAGPDPYHPTILLAGKETIFLGDDPAFQLAGEPAGFNLKFNGDHALDGGILVRDHVLSYQVQGNQVVRVNPVALTAEDFLDEWVSMPWHDAARWSDPSNLSDLRRWHSFLHQKKSWTTDGLLFVQPCDAIASGTSPTGPAPTSPSRWQIGLNLIPKTSDDSEGAEGHAYVPSSLFFTVVRRNGDLMMVSIDSTRPPGCPGESPPEAFTRQ